MLGIVWAQGPSPVQRAGMGTAVTSPEIPIKSRTRQPSDSVTDFQEFILNAPQHLCQGERRQVLQHY